MIPLFPESRSKRPALVAEVELRTLFALEK
jgi:hypothetical protein